MSVDILIGTSIFHHIIITPSESSSTYVVTINSFTGRPFYSGIPLVDIFPDHSFAVHQVEEHYETTARYTGENIIGIAKDSNVLAIGLIDGAEVTGWMPGGSLVKTVRHIKYITLPQNAKTSFEQYQLANNHLFCEGYDITRPFPSQFPSYNPDDDFVYNTEWIQPFRDINLPQCCVSLVQGLCLSSSLPGRDFTITYILRRSSLNPGTRYLARGLNDQKEPANEIECELIYTRNKQFWTQRWRRGSAPIRWQTQLPSAFSKPVHKAKEDFNNGTSEYFHKLMDRFGSEIPIRCISLLESGENKSENDVHNKYQKAIALLNEQGIGNVIYEPFNLNSYLHKYGTFEALKELEKLVIPYLQNDGFTTGTIPNEVVHNQQGLLRFNCADSLDRVNLATFFYSLIVTEQWLNANYNKITDSNLVPDDLTSSESNEPNQNVVNSPENDQTHSPKNGTSQQTIDLKETKNTGIREKSQSVSYFNEHDIKRAKMYRSQSNSVVSSNASISSRTSSSLFPINSPLLTQDIIDFLARAFVISGNIASQMYTNTQAIKVDHIKKFSPTIQVDQSETTVTLQRRLQNVAYDANRNKIIQQFVHPGQIVTRVVVDPEHIFPYTGIFPRDLFNLQTLDVIVNRNADGENNLVLALPRPMIVSKIILRHCNASSMFILSGMSLNNLYPIGQFQIPRVKKWCKFVIDRTSNESYESDTKNDFNANVALFVSIRFFSTPNQKLLCGNIQLECDLPIEGDLCNKWLPHADIETEQIFESKLDEFLKTPRTLKDALELEKARIALKIADDVRNKIAVHHHINPFLCDSNSLMTVLSHETNQIHISGCAFCGKQIVQKQVEYFSQSTIFPGLITPYVGGSKYLPCCSDCLNTAEDYVALTEIYSDQFAAPIVIPKFEQISEMPEKINHIYDIAFPSTVRFPTEEENLLLTKNGGNIIVESKRSFTAFFFKNSIISTITIKATSTDFKLMYMNEEIPSTAADDSSLIFQFKVEPLGHEFAFDIVGNTTLQTFRCKGLFVREAEEMYEKLKKFKPVPEVVSYGYEWVENDRYAIYKFDGKKILSEIGLEIHKTENYKIATSLMFVYYDNNTIVGTMHLKLPWVMEGTNMWYKVETEPFNKLIVYYMDREADIKPHLLGFTFVQ